jgi:phospho-N-acetylmuramoyl-pentapeptide-transferase
MLDGFLAVSFKMVLLVTASMLVFAAFGLVDDLAGLARRSGRKELGVGLGAKQMLVLQLVASAALSTLALHWLGATTITSGLLPGSIALPGGFLLATLGLLGTVNGVNLSDGLDGLAAGLLALAFAASAWILVGVGSGEGPSHAGLGGMDWFVGLADFKTGLWLLALLAALAAGACLGFLWYNRHPARVFMGNVASMGLGGALAMMFIVSGLWWLLPIVGAVFVAEVLSVIIQVGYFKWSGGKRVFRMAPFHHHFEEGGMHETQVVRRFWIAGALAGLLAIALFVRLVA